MLGPWAFRAAIKEAIIKSALNIHVSGVVQGVGFRPFVYRQAKRHLVTGWVLNAADGVTIHAEGEDKLLDEFVLALANQAPAAAKVEEITLDEVPLEDFESFEIRQSDEGEARRTTLVSPDLATCPDCVGELFDPADRRYRYPFVNCTNCGPRFTIIDCLPYDRKATSMAEFAMCAPCEKEYADPLDRRFHAQPDACFACGPELSWYVRAGEGWQEFLASCAQDSIAVRRERSDEILAEAVKLLQAGKILAVKGVGGFHLVCDAGNGQVVATLRQRKHRDGKALAVMVQDVEAARAYCLVNEAEEQVLSGTVRPIVLLRKRGDEGALPLATGLADGLGELGVMLPYTPLQHLLIHDFVQAGGAMLVMTSGNLHDEPIVTDDEEALTKLAGIADAVLGNNRPILSRYDDSVVRVIDGAGEPVLQMVRRARGYAPMPLTLDPTLGIDLAEGASLFATGPEQKNTFCLLRAGQAGDGGAEAFVSQHIGDLENEESFDAWREAKERFKTLFRMEPSRIACDKHPEYLSTKWAHEQVISPLEVQHHHAHIVSVMAEAGLPGPVCGIAFDGTGYGMDGTIWGGEVLLANLQDFERFANFAYVPMPGGAAAVKNPLRMAYGVLWAYDLLDHPVAAQALAEVADAAELMERMIERGINTPFTSSVGRLFDAASALLGICPHPTYEGEAAMMLEAAIDPQLAYTAEGTPAPSRPDPRYSIAIVKNTAGKDSTAHDTSVLLLDAAPTFAALLDDLEAHVPIAVIAQRFHDAFVQVIAQIAQLVDAMYGITTVALSGGVFMNRYLMEHALPELAALGYTVALSKELPPNDGGISLGQAVIASNM